MWVVCEVEWLMNNGECVGFDCSLVDLEVFVLLENDGLNIVLIDGGLFPLLISLNLFLRLYFSYVFLTGVGVILIGLTITRRMTDSH